MTPYEASILMLLGSAFFTVVGFSLLTREAEDFFGDKTPFLGIVSWVLAVVCTVPFLVRVVWPVVRLAFFGEPG